MKIEKYFFAHSIFFFTRFGRSGSVLHISTYQIGIPIYLQWKIGIQRLLTKWHILRKNQRPSLTARNYFYLLHSSLQLSINIEYADQRACLYSIEIKLPLYHKLHSVMPSFASIPYSIVINFLQLGINNDSLKTKEISIYLNEICIASNFPDG